MLVCWTEAITSALTYAGVCRPLLRAKAGQNGSRGSSASRDFTRGVDFLCQLMNAGALARRGGMLAASSHEITVLLLKWGNGDAQALTELMPLVYPQLRRLARTYLRRESPGHSFQSAALVNDAYLRLVEQRSARWQCRAHFFGVASSLMRRILVDHARRQRAAKRGGSPLRLALHDAVAMAEQRDLDLIGLDAALTELGKLDERQARIVELRFFGGLSVDATAEVLGISTGSVKRAWASAKAWLNRRMHRQLA